MLYNIVQSWIKESFPHVEVCVDNEFIMKTGAYNIFIYLFTEDSRLGTILISENLVQLFRGAANEAIGFFQLCDPTCFDDLFEALTEIL